MSMNDATVADVDAWVCRDTVVPMTRYWIPGRGKTGQQHRCHPEVYCALTRHWV